MLAMALCITSIGLLSKELGAQSTISSGSIQGTLTDPSGAVVPNAKVTIKNISTGQVVERTSSSSGVFTSGPLTPGRYTIHASATGFSSVETLTDVQVGNTTTANLKLTVGSDQQTVEVAAQTTAVNTEQATVQGVLNTDQIERLPVSGRNFLDLAQLEPGVQIQDGGNFDPTKNGFSSVSFGGRAGRTARVTVDGIDISDETVGTTTQNVSASAISEFQVSQSTLDLSTELTSSGSVNVVTKSGSNTIHGDGFYNFRDKRTGIANFPGDANNYFQRNQMGGSASGAFVKDKLFWFANAERVKQDTLVPINPTAPFDSLPRGYSSPFKDTTLLGKLDYNGPKGIHVFYRFNYNWNSNIAANGTTYQPFANRDNTPSHGAGIDWSMGNFTHSIRYGHLKFQNHIADAVLGGGVFDPAGDVPVAIRIGGAASPYRFGPSRLAPQATFQKNDQLKYDGSWFHGSHLLRFGVDFNAIRGGGLASFYETPEIRASSFGSAAAAYAATGPYAGGSTNPLNYQVSQILLGNGQGFATETAAFGYPAGGQHDNRFAFYFGDVWKIRPNFTLTAGLRYSRDTGRQDSDLDPITCDQIPATTLAQLAPSQVPCSGKDRLLDQFGGNYGGKIRQPNNNFGPQVGFAWDPTGHGKTSIRGGGGLYYENAIFNNVLFDRPVRLSQGLFNVVSTMCPDGQLTIPSGVISSFDYNGSTVSLADLCSAGRIGDVLNQVSALASFYHQQTASGGAAANAGFIGASLSASVNGPVLDPNYRTPRSWQMNLGVQHEITSGTVVSADFVRNVGLRFLLGLDANHVGDIRYFNKAAAQAAIDTTLSQFGVSTIDQAIAQGATMEDFAANGLGSGADAGAGLPASLAGINSGYAFGGINPLVGTGIMLTPVGRSTYTALQLKLNSQLKSPVSWIPEISTQVAYSISRFNSMAADQDFVGGALDFANPTKYFGPSSLDRTHQLAFGTVMRFRRGPELSFIGHFNSPLSATPTLVSEDRAGEIFYTDLTGDGTVGDVVDQIGTFGRKYDGSGVNKLIDNFNSQWAGKLTPAGQTVVNSGLFTEAQMAALGATVASVPDAPANQAHMGWFRSFDLKLSYPVKIGERLRIVPSVSAFNIFNFVNYNISNAPGQRLTGLLDGSRGSINGTAQYQAPRAGLGTGVNTIGSPRQMEFGLRFAF